MICNKQALLETVSTCIYLIIPGYLIILKLDLHGDSSFPVQSGKRVILPIQSGCRNKAFIVYTSFNNVPYKGNLGQYWVNLNLDLNLNDRYLFFLYGGYGPGGSLR